MLWGGSFPVIKIALASMDPYLLIFLRFFVAFWLSLAIFLWKSSLKKVFKKQTLTVGILLGIVGFFSYFTQTKGLEFTTPPRSAFITQSLILFVYVFQKAFLKKEITLLQWGSLVLIVFGNLLMFYPYLRDSVDFSYSIILGDGLTLLCAVGFASYILLIDGIKENFFSIMIVHFFVIFGFSFLFSDMFGILEEVKNFDITIILSILYLSLFSTLITTGIMFYYQPKVSPVQASIIYSLEPVFALIFSLVFLKTQITIFEGFGALFLFVGSFVGELNPSLFQKIINVNKREI